MNALFRSLVPEPYGALLRLALYAALVASLFLFGYFKGEANVQGKWDTQVAAQKLAVARIETRSAEATVQTVTVYVDRQKKETAAQATIQHEVDQYVPLPPPPPAGASDQPGGVNIGFVRVWNAANAGVPLSGAPGPADAEPSGVVDHDIAAQHAAEAALCRATENQLAGLQQWIRSQQAVMAGKTPSS